MQSTANSVRAILAAGVAVALTCGSARSARADQVVYGSGGPLGRLGTVTLVITYTAPICHRPSVHIESKDSRPGGVKSLAGPRSRGARSSPTEAMTFYFSGKKIPVQATGGELGGEATPELLAALEGSQEVRVGFGIDLGVPDPVTFHASPSFPASIKKAKAACS